MRRARGMTLVELLTVIAIAAILMMVAVPSFTKIIALQRVKSAASNLQVSMYIARAEAVKRNANVCVSTSNTTCTRTGSWNQGWYILDASNTLLGTYPPFASLPITLAVSGDSSSAGVTYQASGRISASSASFTVCSPSISDSRTVNVNLIGVPTVTSGTSGSCP